MARFRTALPVIACCVFAVTGSAFGQSQGQARDEDLRWRMPLQQKADAILANTFQHNWFMGTYRPAMEIDAVTNLPNHTVLGNGSDMHTSTWTGSFLMGAAFRYGWAKEHGTPADVEAALNLGGGMVNGLYILSHVSGKPGFLSREVVAYGYGPTVRGTLRRR